MKRPLIVLLLLIVLTSCSPKEQARISGGSFKSLVGAVPADVCRVDGQPQIISASMDEGDLHLIYVRNNGDIVLAMWSKNALGGTYLVDAGEFYWTGGRCPSDNQP